MIRTSETKWMPVNPIDSDMGQVYVIIGQEGAPIHLEGWLIFPPGAKKVYVKICTVEPEPEAD